MSEELQKEKVRWACRRGMLETDLFLMPFFEQHYDQLTAEEKVLFYELLKESDAHLIVWLMETEKPDSKYEKLLSKIRACKLGRP